MDFMLFAATIVAISGCCVWAFGFRRDRICLQAALMGAAISPSVTAMAVYFCFIALSFLFPSRILFVLFPLVVSAGLALWFGRRSRTAINWRGLIPKAVLCGIFFFAVHPFLLLVWTAVSHPNTPHDLSIYLLQATDLSQMMRTGAQTFSTWWSYQNPYVSQPHGISFPLFLAWGFLFVDTPGYGSDLIPKALVAWTILSVIAACVALLSRKNLIWGLCAGISVVASSGFITESWALSRDSFYIAPMIILIFLLIPTKPGYSPKQIPNLLVQSLTLISILLGHSLGIVYATSIFIAYFFVTALRYRLRAIRIPSVWLVGTGLAAGAAASFARYFGIGAAKMGFYFPFYVDPFQLSILKTASPFAVEPSVATLVQSVLATNGIVVWWLLPLLPAIAVVARRIYGNRLGYNDVLWLILGLAAIACFCIVLFLPIQLDGLSLAGAFMANFRYSFGLGILLMLFIVTSAMVCADELSKHLESKAASSLLDFSLAAVLAVAIFLQSKADWTNYAPVYDSMASIRDEACAEAREAKPRTILIDDSNMFYICPGGLLNVYSEKGILITGVDGDKNISSALDAQRIDAVVFYHSPALWSGTRLYRYLKRNWKLVSSTPSRAEVLLRP